MNHYFTIGGALIAAALAAAPVTLLGAENAPAGEDCLKCHSPIQAALNKKVKHAAVEKGCVACHVNHRQKAAGKEKIEHYLKEKQPAVCIGCHDAKDAKIAAAHKGQPFDKAQCTGCHDPHASDLPKLMAADAHGPFGARQCNTCHKPPQDGKIVLTAASASELCFQCHNELAAKLKAAKSKHSLLAADANSCVDCHDPHATNQKQALKRPAQSLCISCHAGVTAGKKYVHEPVGVSCIFCHDPHASDFPRSLRARTQDLCLGCHGPNGAKILASKQPFPLFEGRVSVPPQAFTDLKYLDLSPDGKIGHPMLGHPVFAPAAGGKPEMNCLTCHVSHGAAASRQLLVSDKGTLCFGCHKK